LRKMDAAATKFELKNKARAQKRSLGSDSAIEQGTAEGRAAENRPPSCVWTASALARSTVSSSLACRNAEQLLSVVGSAAAHKAVLERDLPQPLSETSRRGKRTPSRYRTSRETTTTPSAVSAVKRKKTLPLLSREPASQSRRGRKPIPTARLLSQLTATAIEAVAELACDGVVDVRERVSECARRSWKRK